MYESIVVVGDRGQITIPKIIREKKGINPRDKAIVKIEGEKIVIEKAAKELARMHLEEEMKEYYSKYAELHRQINKEWEALDKEANRFLDDY
ncbi:MAG TPA: AbrB/MazE/SpoVT family DNA-binding domain-containing protein [archaeon]|nr:AbrB/MazE/SpoVT family DNA-binding domain-containing protein [archaeon]